MAANYWNSTQYRYWTFTKVELADLRRSLERVNAAVYQKYPAPDRRLMSIYFQQNLSKLARRMNLRQQALATAQVYLRRFYLRVEMRKTNPYLIMATAVYLACKTEECPQHIRLMLGEAVRQWPELGVSESSKIGECEFALISTLSSRLILHHPYRTLGELAPIFNLSAEEQSLAHSIINDSYNTDLCLTNPPHIIAITAIFLAVVMRPASQSTLPAYALSASPHGPSPLQTPCDAILASQVSKLAPATPGVLGGPTLSASAAQSTLMGLKQAGPKLSRLVDWLAESNIDLSAIVNATQEIVSLYEVWETYNERACKDAISRWMGALNK